MKIHEAKSCGKICRINIAFWASLFGSFWGSRCTVFAANWNFSLIISAFSWSRRDILLDGIDIFSLPKMFFFFLFGNKHIVKLWRSRNPFNRGSFSKEKPNVHFSAIFPFYLEPQNGVLGSLSYWHWHPIRIIVSCTHCQISRDFKVELVTS